MTTPILYHILSDDIMRGSGLTCYRPEQGGGFLDFFVKDVVNEMKVGAKKEAWKGFKSGGP